MENNPLLVNMVNKIKVINTSLSQIQTFKNGGLVELGGINRMTLSRGKTTNTQFDEVSEKLINERENLIIRCMRMGHHGRYT